MGSGVWKIRTNMGGGPICRRTHALDVCGQKSRLLIADVPRKGSCCDSEGFERAADAVARIATSTASERILVARDSAEDGAAALRTALAVIVAAEHEAPQVMRWLTFARNEMRTSDWGFYGLTYAGIFAAMVGAGITAMCVLGPQDNVQKRSSSESHETS